MLWRNEGFLEVFELVRTRYEQRLGAEGKLDFHDLINRAAHYIREGKWETWYRYVLVDEFQDISAGRMKLLQVLKRDDTAYFLVGDDWQSINRFAGSDVGLLRNCGDYLGHVQTRTLSKTFRIRRRHSWSLNRVRAQRSRAVEEDADIRERHHRQGYHRHIRRRSRRRPPARPGGHSDFCTRQCSLRSWCWGAYKSSEKALQGKTPSEEFSTVHRAKGREGGLRGRARPQGRPLGLPFANRGQLAA